MEIFTPTETIVSEKKGLMFGIVPPYKDSKTDFSCQKVFNRIFFTKINVVYRVNNKYMKCCIQGE